MSGRRRSRTRRAGQPRTLRSRLVVACVTLIAVVCAVIGTVTTLALREHLDDQLNGQVEDAGKRLSGPFKPGGGDAPANEDRIEGFVTKGPVQTGAVAAEAAPAPGSSGP